MSYQILLIIELYVGWAIARIRQVLSHYYYFDILLILFCIYLIMGLSVIIKEFSFYISFILLW